MNALRKYLKTTFAVLVFLFVVPTVSAQENKIESIHVEVELHEDGSATINETRQMETHEDTELYIELENLQDTELLDFHVEGFTEEEEWDIEASFEEKANKYGVLEVDDGYELAWGITEYGNPEYHISYSLSNLVRSLEDGEALFWNFDSFLSLPTDRLTLEVSVPFNLEENILGFYGFGFEGPIDINNGILQWTGYGLDDSNNVTILMQFPTGTFQTTTQVDMTLDEQQEMATEGSSYNEDEPMPTWAIVMFSVLGLTGVGAIAGGAAYGIRGRNIRKENNHFYPMDLITENREKTSPNPPQIDGDIGKYSAIISKIVQTGAGFSEYFFSYLLLWSLEDKIIIETNEIERKLLGPKTEARMTIQNYEEEIEMNQLSFKEYVDLFEIGESTLEEVFWSMLLEASGHQEIAGEDIEQWSEEHTEDIADLGQLMEEVSEEWLEENDYLKNYTVKDWGVKFQVKELTEKGETLATNVIQFDNFIQNIKEVSLSEYENWHELIVWAALFGKAEDTVEYLEEFHPQTWDYLLAAYPGVYGHYYGYHYFYVSNTKGLATGGYSGSGAGGGFSSAGGGAGAGGGGGGGSR